MRTLQTYLVPVPRNEVYVQVGVLSKYNNETKPRTHDVWPGNLFDDDGIDRKGNNVQILQLNVVSLYDESRAAVRTESGNIDFGLDAVDLVNDRARADARMSW